MAGTLRYVGFLVVVGVIVAAILGQMADIPALRDNLKPGLVTQIALLGAAMIAAGFLLPIFGKAGSAVVGRRCARCGKKIEKGQVYCRDHQQAALNEARDQQRSYEDTAMGRKRSK